MKKERRDFLDKLLLGILILCAVAGFTGGAVFLFTDVGNDYDIRLPWVEENSVDNESAE